MREFSDIRAMNPGLVSLIKPQSPDAERYQRLRLAVENAANPGRSVVIAVTSPCIGEGKTLTAINLAGALAQNNSSRVLLLELDLRSNAGLIDNYLGSAGGVRQGVSHITSSETPAWQSLIWHVASYHFDLLPAGKQSPLPYEVLNSPQLEALIAEARQRYDYIIVDTAAVTLYPDTQLISRWVDKFIILVASGTTSKKQLGDCLNLMPPDKVLGLLFNKSEESAGERHGH